MPSLLIFRIDLSSKKSDSKRDKHCQGRFIDLLNFRTVSAFLYLTSDSDTNPQQMRKADVGVYGR